METCNDRTEWIDFPYVLSTPEEDKDRASEDVRHALASDVDEISRQGEKYTTHMMSHLDDDTVEDDFFCTTFITEELSIIKYLPFGDSDRRSTPGDGSEYHDR